MMSVCNVVLCLGRLLGLLQGRAVSSWRREPGASGQWPVSQRPVRLQLQAENDGGRHPGGGRAAPFALAYARPGRDEPNRGRGTKSCRYRTPCGADAENISGSLCGRIRGLGQSSLTGHRLRSGRISRAGPQPTQQLSPPSPHRAHLTSLSHTHTPPSPDDVASWAFQPSNGAAWDRGRIPPMQETHITSHPAEHCVRPPVAPN
jgi:hypothetical protein